jgi:hypothetical protein
MLVIDLVIDGSMVLAGRHPHCVLVIFSPSAPSHTPLAVVSQLRVSGGQFLPNKLRHGLFLVVKSAPSHWVSVSGSK